MNLPVFGLGGLRAELLLLSTAFLGAEEQSH